MSRIRLGLGDLEFDKQAIVDRGRRALFRAIWLRVPSVFIDLASIPMEAFMNVKSDSADAQEDAFIDGIMQDLADQIPPHPEFDRVKQIRWALGELWFRWRRYHEVFAAFISPSNDAERAFAGALRHWTKKYNLSLDTPDPDSNWTIERAIHLLRYWHRYSDEIGRHPDFDVDCSDIPGFDRPIFRLEYQTSGVTEMPIKEIMSQLDSAYALRRARFEAGLRYRQPLLRLASVPHKESEHFEWLALFQCAKCGYAEIARSVSQVKGTKETSAKIEKGVKATASLIDLPLRESKRGRPKKQKSRGID